MTFWSDLLCEAPTFCNSLLLRAVTHSFHKQAQAPSECSVLGHKDEYVTVPSAKGFAI